jgi:hypothetical protein
MDGPTCSGIVYRTLQFTDGTAMEIPDGLDTYFPSKGPRGLISVFSKHGSHTYDIQVGETKSELERIIRLFST